MKRNIISVLFFGIVGHFAPVITHTAQAQEVNVFSENMGAPAATTDIASHTFENSGSAVYTGTADVRNTLPSTGDYPGASGGGNVWFAVAGNPYFQISSIDIAGFGSFEISFGLAKTTTAEDGSNFLVTVYIDDEEVMTYVPTLATGPNTANRYTYHTFALPATAEGEEMTIRFEKIGGTSGFRIDDVLIVGDGAPMASDLLNFSLEVNHQSYQFSWSTGYEYDIQYFEIEGSANGKEFNSVYRCASKQDPLGSRYVVSLYQLYQYSYFRLKIVSKSGNISYSETIHTTPNWSDIYIAAIDAHSIVIVSGQANRYCIVDIQGRVVIEGLVSPGQHNINISPFVAGNYILVIGDKRIKFSKQ